MAQTIWKFSLEVADRQVIRLPEGAGVLDVQNQHERPCLWALVDPEAEAVERVFYTFGTGHEVKTRGIKYVGSYQLSGGAFVGHVFEAAEGSV